MSKVQQFLIMQTQIYN